MEEIQKLQKSINKKISFTRDNFEINDDIKLLNQIDKLKKDNINYIKTHTDSIPEYHILIIQLKEEIHNIINDK